MYEDILKAAGIFMHNNGKVTPTDACVTLCKALLDTAQSVPEDSLFRDDRFQETCFRLCNANEAKVVRDISPLIVPSGEILHAFGVEQLGHLTDHVNEKWYGLYTYRLACSTTRLHYRVQRIGLLAKSTRKVRPIH
jgi:hypothetical protein